jgi:hypothetical protein
VSNGGINNWNFGLTVFMLLRNGVGLELFMFLLEILCFFDLGSEDLGDETSAK